MSAIVFGPIGIVEVIAACTADGAATFSELAELPAPVVESADVVVVIVVVVELLVEVGGASVFVFSAATGASIEVIARVKAVMAADLDKQLDS